MARSVSQLSRQEIGDGLEVARKFCLKTLTDPELDKYLSQIPLAWRAEVKTLSQSLTNLGFALFNRDLIYDLKLFMLEVMEQKNNKWQRGSGTLFFRAQQALKKMSSGTEILYS